MNKDNNHQAGKGDSPRNCFSEKYRINYENIKWNKKNDKNQINTNISSASQYGVSAP